MWSFGAPSCPGQLFLPSLPRGRQGALRSHGPIIFLETPPLKLPGLGSIHSGAHPHFLFRETVHQQPRLPALDAVVGTRLPRRLLPVSRSAVRVGALKGEAGPGSVTTRCFALSSVSGQHLCALGAVLSSSCPHVGFFFNLSLFLDFICLFLDRGEGREKERETSVWACLSHAPYWGPGSQPRHVH